MEKKIETTIQFRSGYIGVGNLRRVVGFLGTFLGP